MIRRCRKAADFELADRLCRACGPKPSPVPSKFPDHRGAVWVHFVLGKEEGFAFPNIANPRWPTGFVAANVKEDGTLDVATCGVEPDYRGRGILRQLLRAVHAWGRAQGCELAACYTAANNWPSMCNFMRAGYRVVGYRADETALGGGWVELERRL